MDLWGQGLAASTRFRLRAKEPLGPMRMRRNPPTPLAVERVGRPSFYVIPLLILSLRIHSRIFSMDLALHSRMLLRLLGLLGPSPPRYIAKNNNVIFFIIDIQTILSVIAHVALRITMLYFLLLTFKLFSVIAHIALIIQSQLAASVQPSFLEEVPVYSRLLTKK